MCVCVSVHMNACMHSFMHACMHARTHACMHACVYVCLSVCLSACLYVCMYACMHACMHACMYLCMYVCTYVGMYVCMHLQLHPKPGDLQLEWFCTNPQLYRVWAASSNKIQQKAFCSKFKWVGCSGFLTQQCFASICQQRLLSAVKVLESCSCEHVVQFALQTCRVSMLSPLQPHGSAISKL